MIDDARNCFKSLVCEKQLESTKLVPECPNFGPFVDSNLFELNIGSSEVPRFNCACHVLNLVVGDAIGSHSDISDLIKQCNQVSVDVRRSVKESALFRTNRCMLRRENETRWSSTLLMLDSLIRANQRVQFEFENPEDQLDFDKIETYYQILRLVHLVSLNFQKLTSSIGEVIPGLFILLKIFIYYNGSRIN